MQDSSEFITPRPETIPELSAMFEALTSHREAIVGRIARLDWWRNAVPLNVRCRGKIDDARAHLRRWCTSSAARHAVLVGAPGAGKSGLVWWAASIIADLPDAIPLIIPAPKLRTQRRIDLALLFATAVPSITSSIWQSIVQKRRLFVLIDGLDELSGIGAGGATLASALIESVMDVLPAGTRVLASCRTVAFPRMESLLSSHLPREVKFDDDLYEGVLAKTFGTADDLEVLEVCPVSRDQAHVFLGQFVDKSVLSVVSSDCRWAQFLTSPILLLLARKTFSDVTEMGVPTLGALFPAYVRHALLRNNPGISEREISNILTALKQFSNFINSIRHEEHLHRAFVSGILREEDDDYDWSHYTLWEYFFGSFLFDEILAYSSKTMAHVDLVEGYNINRFLIPMLNEVLHKTGGGRLSPITPSEYIRFTKATGWRVTTGYGLHPSASRSKMGVPSASFSFDPEQAAAVHADWQHGLGWNRVACQISWYDAAVFSHYAGGRLPTSAEILAAAPKGDLLFWCSDWLLEDVAHICAYDGKSGTIVGLNPDVRLRRTALAIMR